MQFSVYNQLSNNGNLAIYLSIAARNRPASFQSSGNYSLAHFFRPHGHLCHFSSRIHAKHRRMSSALACFSAAKNLHSRWDLIFFLSVPANVCICTCCFLVAMPRLALNAIRRIRMKKSRFWWQAARRECFAFRRKGTSRTETCICRSEKSGKIRKITSRFNTHCNGGRPRLSLSSRMHGKNNIYGNN